MIFPKKMVEHYLVEYATCDEEGWIGWHVYLQIDEKGKMWLVKEGSGPNGEDRGLHETYVGEIEEC